MRRRHNVLWLLVFFFPTAFAESDEEILQKVRANAEKIYIDQASFTLPKSFHDSGLAPSDKKRLITKWASESAECMVDALALYAETTDVPLSELVNDDLSFGLKGGSPSKFNEYLDACLAGAWEAVGARLP